MQWIESFCDKFAKNPNSFIKDFDNLFDGIPIIDTCTEETASLCKISGGRGGKFKLPTLIELNRFLLFFDFYNSLVFLCN